ncbi:lipopolysaccharide biosynthesis protein [Maribacter hydrothermalis]|uniref:lipopolysaccharide biosynthesis protein n=1 Tax=Maribacter hydrothermalis TaxID=1836467 RepID=UPI0021D1B625|nr:lipopolysaccharide biosynthesis protein [Maribacter hydrothermalis]
MWSSLEKFSVQGVSAIIGIVLTRLLEPVEIGNIGLLIVFISFSQVFIDSGFSTALIQKQNRSKEDINTVFVFNFMVAVICYTLIWVAAPYISDFYEVPKLTAFIRLLSVCLFFNAAITIPQTLLTIKMDFKSMAKVNVSASIISGFIAIYLAYKGFGELALIWQILIKTLITAVYIWVIVNYKPKFEFNLISFKSLFSFGSKLLISSLLNNITNNIASLFIGKVISVKSLGYYSRGTQFADMVFGPMYSVYNSVFLPSLSAIQNEKELLVSQTRGIIKMSSSLVFPLFFFLAVVAKPMIILVLTEKWIAAAPIMSIICIARAITIISSININLLYAIGRSDLVLKQQYYKLLVRIIFLLISLKFGIIWIAVAELLATTVHFFINTYYPSKYMKYGALAQINDAKGSILISILLSIITLLLFHFITNIILQIIISMIIFSLVYYFMAKIFGMTELEKLLTKCKKMIWSKK